jgi:hypothetical protein
MGARRVYLRYRLFALALRASVRRRLLEALLAEALAPADARELEAAE